MIRILLGTPTANDTVHMTYCSSLLRLTKAFHEQRPGVDFAVQMTSGSLLENQRNALATKVLLDPEFTHLLFVDADMGFSPSLIAKMLDFNRPVVGCIYPRRVLNAQAAYEEAKVRASAGDAFLAGQGFVGDGWLVPEPGPKEKRPRYRVTQGFVRAETLGTGIMLVQRSALQQMREMFPELWVEGSTGPYEPYSWCAKGVFQCFARMQREDKLYISEDLAFCERWTKGCGGELWASVSEPIEHVGRHVFRGAYADKLRLQYEKQSARRS